MLNPREIYITETDMRRLQPLIEGMKNSRDDLRGLQAELEKARVVAPIGTAMIGHRVGDEFSWDVPAGSLRLRVEEVLYQPEAAGHHHL
jgi:hypothetical protein